MGDSTNHEHQAEVEARWGETEAYRQSKKRTASYSKDEWAEIHSELDAIESDFADAMSRGVATDAGEAVALAERARKHIDRWYYTCSPAMHEKLADMYTSDDRFKAHYEGRQEGLAEYVSAAIKANAARDQATSNRSRLMTLSQAATKSRTKRSSESSEA